MISALIGTAANIAFNAINNRRNLKNYYEMRSYNSPAAQMQRYRSAGLNPHLIYTQSNEVDAPPEMHTPDLSPLQNASSELSAYQGIKESKARVSNLEKQNEMLSEQIYGRVLENELNKIGLKWSDYEHWLNTEQGKQAIKNAKKTYEYIESQIDNLTRNTKFKDFEEFKGWFDMMISSEQLKIAFSQLSLDWEKFREQVRQFNEVNFLKDWFDKFIKGFSGDNPQQVAESLGALIRSLIDGQEYSEGSGLPLLDVVRNYFRDTKRRGGSF